MWHKLISTKTLRKWGLQQKESLIFQCNISVKRGESSTATYNTTLMPKEHTEMIASNYAEMLADLTFSDFEILCQSKSFPCHKAVLAAWSKVFKTLLDDGAIMGYISLA